MISFAAILLAAQSHASTTLPLEEISRLGYVVSKSPKGPYAYRGTFADRIDLCISVQRLSKESPLNKIDRQLFTAPIFLNKALPASGLPLGTECMSFDHLPNRVTIYTAANDWNIFVYATDFKEPKKRLHRDQVFAVERITRYALAMAPRAGVAKSSDIDMEGWARSGRWQTTRDAAGNYVYRRGGEKVVVPLASNSIQVGGKWHGLSSITYLNGDKFFAPTEAAPFLPKPL